MMKISAVMTPCPYTINSDQTLEQTLKMMQLRNIRHLPVVDGGKLVGVVSETELKLSKFVCDATKYCPTVGEVCVRDPYVVDIDADLGTVAAEMSTKKHDSALIVSASGALEGIFTTTDACRAISLLLGT